ncbi:MAG: class I tRNA ligase family protein, partial [Candidatus Moraniibacteriota bacterium]
LDEMKAWNTASIIGLRRFLEKVWKLQEKKPVSPRPSWASKSFENRLNKTIKKVTEDIAELKFNTAISALMILVNEMGEEVNIPEKHFKTTLILLAPFAPHMTEELWSMLGEKKSIFLAPWPKYDSRKIREETKTIGVQVNGKVRGTIDLAVDATEAEAKALALADPKIQAQIEGKQVRKCIYVPGRILNFVVTD